VTYLFGSFKKLARAASSLYYVEKNLGKKNRGVGSLEEMLNANRARLDALMASDSSSLDLGCGPQPQNPFAAAKACGVDIRDDVDQNVVKANLMAEPIPFGAREFEFCTAINFIEHLPRVIVDKGSEVRFPVVQLMNEIHRILKPSGFFLSVTPAYPSKEAFQDPTHVNIITEETFPSYFCAGEHGEPWARIYGFRGRFELVDQAWLHNAFLITLMQTSA
jgi:SAM-dependent methyltransferase